MMTLWFRGNKAENAAVAGCSGLIIFMDPSTVAMWVILIYRILFLSFYAQHVFFRQGTDEADVYPNTFWMPGTAVQVFSVLNLLLFSLKQSARITCPGGWRPTHPKLAKSWQCLQVEQQHRVSEIFFQNIHLPPGSMRRTDENTCPGSQSSLWVLDGIGIVYFPNRWVTQMQSSFSWGWRESLPLKIGKEVLTWFTSELKIASVVFLMKPGLGVSWLMSWVEGESLLRWTTGRRRDCPAMWSGFFLAVWSQTGAEVRPRYPVQVCDGRQPSGRLGLWCPRPWLRHRADDGGEIEGCEKQEAGCWKLIVSRLCGCWERKGEVAGVPRGASCSSAGELKSTVSADPGEPPLQSPGVFGSTLGRAFI